MKSVNEIKLNRGTHSTSQALSAVSPNPNPEAPTLKALPVASVEPSGANATHTIASEWPARVEVQRVTALTRNTACGMYTIDRHSSIDAP